MRVLLDECLPRPLRRYLTGHEAITAPDAGSASKRNGELLALAVSAKFDVFLTVDRNLSYQQDVSSFDIAVVVLLAKGNRLIDLQPLVPELLTTLPTALRGCATLVPAASSKTQKSN